MCRFAWIVEGPCCAFSVSWEHTLPACMSRQFAETGKSLGSRSANIFRYKALAWKKLYSKVRDREDALASTRAACAPQNVQRSSCVFQRLGRLKLMSKKMRVVQVPRAGGPLELVERDIPEPERGWVRVKVEACGVCHSDSLVKEGLWPGIQYPRVPGHEVIGVVDGVGEGVKPWETGQRVGVGWHGGNCGYCDHCRRGEFFACTVALLTTGISFDGGYAEYMVAPAEALALVPDELSAVDGAPLMCAGVTTFNALRNSGARGGDVVAVLGIGGLGHLGVQFAARMGFNTVAIARGKDKERSRKNSAPITTSTAKPPTRRRNWISSAARKS